MSCNFWCHETKQVNEAIETWNNENKRDMIRQKKKDRQRRDHIGASMISTNKWSKFTSRRWDSKEVVLHQCVIGVLQLLVTSQFFSWSMSTLWVQNIENNSREVVKWFARVQGQNEASFWELKVYKPFSTVNYQISFGAYCKLVVV